jgi:hypothetical protein
MQLDPIYVGEMMSKGRCHPCTLSPIHAHDQQIRLPRPVAASSARTRLAQIERQQLLCAAMRRAWMICALVMTLSAPSVVRADGNYGYGEWLIVLGVASFLPSSVGVGAEHQDTLHVPIIVSWATQIPLSGDGGRVNDEFGTWRLVIDPMLVIDDRGVDFELRVAPRLTVTESDDLALFVSAGSTAKWGPFKPSAHFEVGLITGTTDLEIRYWIALRADAWFGDVSAQRVSLAVGWAIW